MLINFEKIDETVIPQFRGGEKNTIARMFVDEKVKIMNGKLESGASIGMHTHDTSCEIIYILSGKGKVIYDGTEERLEQGSCHYCPIGHTHSLINDSDSDLLFFAVVPEQA